MGVSPVLVGVLAAVSLVALLAIQQFAYVPGISIFAGHLQNALHVPFFIVLTWLCWQCCAFTRDHRLLVCATTMVLLAGVTELIQMSHGRLMAVDDFARNLAGAVAALCWFATPHRWRVAGRLAGSVVVVVALSQFLMVTFWYAQRWQAAPVLMEADRSWSQSFVRAARADLRWPDAPGGFVAVMPRHTEQRVWWSMHVDEVWPDWGTREWLCVDVRTFDGNRQWVYAGIKFWAGESPSGRFVRRLPLQGGPGGHLAIALDQVAHHLQRDSVDGVAGVVLFGAGPGIRVRSMWLSDVACKDSLPAAS